MEGIIIAIISLALCSFLLGFMIATDVCNYKKEQNKKTTRKG